MDYFGINSAADLPKLKEVFAETLVEPTMIRSENEADTDNETEPKAETNTVAAPDADAGSHPDSPMMVNGHGELEHPSDDDAPHNGEAHSDEPDTPDDNPQN